MTIRNQRYRNWQVLVVAVSQLIFWSGLAGFGFVTGSREGAFLLASLVGIVSSVVFGVWALSRNTPYSFRLGRDLETRPSTGFHRVADIERVEFEQDPFEDYDDAKLPIPLCKVTITTRSRQPFVMIVSTGDAMRINSWATRNAIAVLDPSGYTLAMRKASDPTVSDS